MKTEAIDCLNSIMGSTFSNQTYRQKALQLAIEALNLVKEERELRKDYYLLSESPAEQYQHPDSVSDPRD